MFFTQIHVLQSIFAKIKMPTRVIQYMYFLVVTVFLSYTHVAILASIVLSCLPGLIELSEARYIWKVDKLGFVACIGGFLGLLFATVRRDWPSCSSKSLTT